MNEGIKPKGWVVIDVYDEEGNLTLHQEQHNVITTQGLGYLADLMSNSPTKTKFTTTSSYIVLGTGYASVSSPSAQTWVYTPTGSPQAMQSGYPMTQSSFPSPVVVYSALFSAGSLNASGINECALVNNPVSGAGVCLAYAQISPSQTINSSSSMQITWQITFA